MIFIYHILLIYAMKCQRLTKFIETAAVELTVGKDMI
jgi:hypothetical protein